MATSTLQLTFRNAEGGRNTMSISDPREDLESAEVEAAMQAVLDRNIFKTTGGELTGKIRAQVVHRETETIFED